MSKIFKGFRCTSKSLQRILWQTSDHLHGIFRLTAIATIIFSSLIFTAENTHAYQIDMNAFYFSDSINPGTEISNNRMMLDFAVGMPFNNKSPFVICWAVTLLSYTLDGGSTAEISTLEHGPRIGWYIDKKKLWSVFATYHLFSTGNFDGGSGALEWRGNSFKVDIGITPQISNSLLVGVRLNYYSASYSEQFDASNTFSEIATTQSMIYPSVTVSYQF